MCNYYRNDIRKAGRERHYYGFDEFSETPLEIYPDVLAPIIRIRGEAPIWQAMRWGFPSPEAGKRPVTNVRNLTSPYWRGWLAPQWRCLVPFTAFGEWTDATPTRQAMFALPGEPMAMFAGIWRPWTGRRGPARAPVDGEHLLFGILTCAPNAVVAQIHAKAMPVILASAADQDAWLSAPLAAVPSLAQPLPDDQLELLAA
ncbi:MAG: SOS response-associated peptidase family protein [Terricaulis sp.]